MQPLSINYLLNKYPLRESPSFYRMKFFTILLCIAIILMTAFTIFSFYQTGPLAGYLHLAILGCFATALIFLTQGKNELGIKMGIIFPGFFVQIILMFQKDFLLFSSKPEQPLLFGISTIIIIFLAGFFSEKRYQLTIVILYSVAVSIINLIIHARSYGIPNTPVLQFSILLGIAIVFSTTMRSLTDRIEGMITKREILLKETNHRVKNNLTMISSFINLQKDTVQDEKTLSILDDLMSRIKSVSFLHDQLNHSEDFSNIPVNDYIRQIVSSLSDSVENPENKIAVRLAIQELLCSSKLVIPIGMIITELLSNAYKYAFPGQKSGEVFISFEKKEKGYILRIADNGTGLPSSARDIRKSESLGLKLVSELVKQIKGTISLKTEKGTDFILSVPADD